MRKIFVAGAALAGMVLFGSAALGAGTTPGRYANWSVSGSSGTGAIDAAGFPGASIASDATSVTVPSGASAFLGPDTPIGAKYGSSRNQTYLNVSSAKLLTPSTTTIAFDRPTPAGSWAFALGDVDADIVMISAEDANGNPVDPAALGFVSTFNYCAASPKPSSCAGPGPFTDVPTWHPMSARLVGNGPDTSGASGWFEPTVSLSKLTFTFSVQIGFPVYQLWMTSLAVPVEVPVDGVTPDSGITDPVTLDLDHTDGTPVADADGSPVTAAPDDHGKAVFPAVVDGEYIIKIVPAPGVKITGRKTVRITVDVTKGPVKVPAGLFSVILPLPVTGSVHALVPITGGGLVLAGAGLMFAVRRKR